MVIQSVTQETSLSLLLYLLSVFSQETRLTFHLYHLFPSVFWTSQPFWTKLIKAAWKYTSAQRRVAVSVLYWGKCCRLSSPHWTLKNQHTRMIWENTGQRPLSKRLGFISCSHGFVLIRELVQDMSFKCENSYEILPQKPWLLHGNEALWQNLKSCENLQIFSKSSGFKCYKIVFTPQQQGQICAALVKGF